MRTLLGIVFVVAACGPKAGAPGPQTGGDGARPGVDGPVTAGTTPVTAAAVCERIFALRDEQCSIAEGYQLSREECIDDMNRSLEARGADARSVNLAAGRCLLDNPSCDGAIACMTALNPYADEQDGSPTDFRTCDDHGKYAPVGVSAEGWAQRKGAGVTRYRDHDSTKETPVEVCGLPAQIDWLMAATCDDGSRPFENGQQAHASRVGNVGPGGTCGSIVDLYEVPCPEGTYAIYIDAYVCPLP